MLSWKSCNDDEESAGEIVRDAVAWLLGTSASGGYEDRSGAKSLFLAAVARQRLQAAALVLALFVQHRTSATKYHDDSEVREKRWRVEYMSREL